MFYPDDDGAAAFAANAVDAESVTETIGGRFSSPITESVANDTLRRLLLAATLPASYQLLAACRMPLAGALSKAIQKG